MMFQFNADNIEIKARIKRIFGLTGLLFLTILLACEDFVDIPPPNTELGQELVFQDDATALSAMAGVYLKLSDGSSFAGGGFSSVTLFEGLYADELKSFSPLSTNSPRPDFFFNRVTPLNSIVSTTWNRCYTIIFECNRILEGVNASNNLTTSLKAQLLGEALFIRAFCHFYLVNLYGDVPLITTSDFRQNTTVSRTHTTEVYQGIITDLEDAIEVLSNSYPSAERVRVNKGAAIAFLSRVYLYNEDYTNAELLATELINNTTQYNLHSDLNTVFLNSSEEAIWQILPQENNTNEGSLFILLAPPTRWTLTNELYDTFEDGDLRKSQWIGSLSSGVNTWYYAFKYKQNAQNAAGTEYSMVLRLAEQYLIRAEARAEQNNISGAQEDLNTIRNRAGLANTTATTKQDLLNAIEQERRVELFTEWGHRFFDLKRWGKLDEVLGTVKPNWDTTDALLPLPQSELLINNNLTQNPGY